MTKIVYSKHIYNFCSGDADIFFKYNNSVVFTQKKEIHNATDIAPECDTSLVVISKCELKDYEGIQESGKYCRGDNIAIQGIICFLTQYPITIHDCYEAGIQIERMEYLDQEPCFRIGDTEDYSENLKIILLKLEEKPDLIITLLDRWRKATYLCNDYETDIFYDEAILNFFHILELLSSTIIDELKHKLNDNVNTMLTNHCKSCLFTDTESINFNNKKDSISSLLSIDNISLATKIKYFLNKYNLLDDNIALFVSNIIEGRNSIAHGRITFSQKNIWPLSSFYNILKDAEDEIGGLSTLTAQMIAVYIGINHWDSHWDLFKKNIMPAKNVISDFINGKIVIKEQDLLKGNNYNTNLFCTVLVE